MDDKSACVDCLELRERVRAVEDRLKVFESLSTESDIVSIYLEIDALKKAVTKMSHILAEISKEIETSHNLQLLANKSMLATLEATQARIIEVLRSIFFK